MAQCNECGGNVATGEHFCGNCGTPQPAGSDEPKTVSAILGEHSALPQKPDESSALAKTDETPLPVEAISAEPQVAVEPTNAGDEPLTQVEPSNAGDGPLTQFEPTSSGDEP